MEPFKQGQVRKILGEAEFSKSKLDTWIKLNYIEPAVPPRRAGHPSGYSVENIFQLKIIDMLADRGLALRQASAIVKSVPDMWKHDFVIVGLDDPTAPEITFDISTFAHEISIVIVPLNIYKAICDRIEEL